MISASATQPDVTLVLDKNGVIQDVTVSNALSDESVDGWIGQPWIDTVGDVAADKVKRLIKDAQAGHVTALRQLTQRFPSGREFLMEYTTVRLGPKAGLIAIGRNLQAVAELQSRLIAAQQSMERDYWKLREVETRYRLLFSTANDAVVLIKEANLRIVELNPSAVRALGLSKQRPDAVIGRDFLQLLQAKERDTFKAMLQRVEKHGKSPGLTVHLSSALEPWIVRASRMAAETGNTLLLHLSPLAGSVVEREPQHAVSMETLIERGPDGFVVIDAKGGIVRANRAFLDLLQVGAEGAVVGEPLERWLGRPGADITVLLSTLQRNGVVRLFSTTVRGELGSETAVEISASDTTENGTTRVAVFVRDVARRLATAENAGLGATLGSLTEQIGKTTLRKLVKDTVGVIERHYVEAALELTSGNRTAAAEVLGLSRQGLYIKLDQYSLDTKSGDPGSDSQG